ncbi:MAG TPA: type II secretion system minor pseudopilin GspH [Gammaproteobacteria bacterium]|jgi:general secretion pathway protein H|nr:type II secretion system minor pseudopilin GspH [Gammaproteobacteria bacterium]
MKKSTRGFTLVEILVVILIVSILTGVALLSLRHNQDQQLAAFTQELTQVMTLAGEQALLQPMVLGLSFDEQKLRFSSYKITIDDEQGEKRGWAPLDDHLLTQRVIPADIQVSMKTVTQDETETEDSIKPQQIVPQIIMSTNGDMTPFTLYISKKGEAPRYAIIGDANGHITSQALS